METFLNLIIGVLAVFVPAVFALFASFLTCFFMVLATKIYYTVKDAVINRRKQKNENIDNQYTER